LVFPATPIAAGREFKKTAQVRAGLQGGSDRGTLRETVGCLVGTRCLSNFRPSSGRVGVLAGQRETPDRTRGGWKHFLRGRRGELRQWKRSPVGRSIDHDGFMVRHHGWAWSAL